MRIDIMGILSETSMHPGTESSTGVLDKPIAREASNDYPVITGSSMKGAFRQSIEERMEKEIANKIFGEHNRAGNVAITDGRILLLPVRTLNGHYRWVTCPYILERFIRDLKLAGHLIDECEIPELDEGEALCNGSEELFLEEIVFNTKKGGDLIKEIVNIIKPMMYHKSLKERITKQLVVINDDDFAYFVRYGLEVRARNELNNENKTSNNLWYEECLPSDTLFYSLFISRTGKVGSLEKIREAFDEYPYIQIGGNETIGQGWCVLSRWEAGSRNEE